MPPPPLPFASPLLPCSQFATLTFVFTVSPSESELGILDLIQVFVEALDRIFNNVCELDLVFGFDEVNYCLAEIVQAGLVLETNISVIAANGACAAACSLPPPPRLAARWRACVALGGRRADAPSLSPPRQSRPSRSRARRAHRRRRCCRRAWSTPRRAAQAAGASSLASGPEGSPGSRRASGGRRAGSGAAGEATHAGSWQARRRRRERLAGRSHGRVPACRPSRAWSRAGAAEPARRRGHPPRAVLRARWCQPGRYGPGHLEAARHRPTRLTSAPTTLSLGSDEGWGRAVQRVVSTASVLWGLARVGAPPSEDGADVGDGQRAARAESREPRPTGPGAGRSIAMIVACRRSERLSLAQRRVTLWPVARHRPRSRAGRAPVLVRLGRSTNSRQQRPTSLPPDHHPPRPPPRLPQELADPPPTNQHVFRQQQRQGRPGARCVPRACRCRRLRARGGYRLARDPDPASPASPSRRQGQPCPGRDPHA